MPPAPYPRVQVIYLIGWAPHESQQRPLARGTGQVSLKDLGLPDTGGRIQLDEPMPPKLDGMIGRKPGRGEGGGEGSKGGTK
jgi:NADH dehydrogenase [ubiquinone] 1 alpha subcomplex assembly factor 5